MTLNGPREPRDGPERGPMGAPRGPQWGLLDIDILCIQKTGIAETSHFVDNGFVVTLSGTSENRDGRSDPGVGFVVAPRAVPAVTGLAALRMKVH
eukprot:4284283-Pyramimonas_sp.AAC.1